MAGSVGSLGISAEEAKVRGIDRAACFRDQVYALLEGGVQIIFFETFMDFDEMAIAYRATKGADCLTICSFSCPPEGVFTTGMPLTDAFAGLREIGADIVGVNCTNGPNPWSNCCNEFQLWINRLRLIRMPGIRNLRPAG